MGAIYRTRQTIRENRAATELQPQTAPRHVPHVLWCGARSRRRKHRPVSGARQHVPSECRKRRGCSHQNGNVKVLWKQPRYRTLSQYAVAVLFISRANISTVCRYPLRSWRPRLERTGALRAEDDALPAASCAAAIDGPPALWSNVCTVQPTAPTIKGLKKRQNPSNPSVA